MSSQDQPGTSASRDGSEETQPRSARQRVTESWRASLPETGRAISGESSRAPHSRAAGAAGRMHLTRTVSQEEEASAPQPAAGARRRTRDDRRAEEDDEEVSPSNEDKKYKVSSYPSNSPPSTPARGGGESPARALLARRVSGDSDTSSEEDEHSASSQNQSRASSTRTFNPETNIITVAQVHAPTLSSSMTDQTSYNDIMSEESVAPLSRSQPASPRSYAATLMTAPLERQRTPPPTSTILSVPPTRSPGITTPPNPLRSGATSPAIQRAEAHPPSATGPARPPNAQTGAYSGPSGEGERNYPPIIVEELQNWPTHLGILRTRLGHIPNARPLNRGIRFRPRSADEYRIIQRYLTELQTTIPTLAWYCYALEVEKPHKVALWGLPQGTEGGLIVEALIERGFPARFARALPTRRGAQKSVYHLQLDHMPADELDRLYRTTDLLNMPRVVIEAWRGKTVVPQCHRCQQFGHSSANCHRPQRCVKCAGPHFGSECPRPAEAPLKCANCQGAHTSNSRTCPVFRREARKRNIRIPGDQRPPQPQPRAPAVQQLRPPSPPARAGARAAPPSQRAAPPPTTLRPPANNAGEYPRHRGRGRARRGRRAVPASTPVPTMGGPPVFEPFPSSARGPTSRQQPARAQQATAPSGPPRGGLRGRSRGSSRGRSQGRGRSRGARGSHNQGQIQPLAAHAETQHAQQQGRRGGVAAQVFLPRPVVLQQLHPRDPRRRGARAEETDEITPTPLQPTQEPTDLMPAFFRRAMPMPVPRSTSEAQTQPQPQRPAEQLARRRIAHPQLQPEQQQQLPEQVPTSARPNAELVRTLLESLQAIAGAAQELQQQAVRAMAALQAFQYE